MLYIFHYLQSGRLFSGIYTEFGEGLCHVYVAVILNSGVWLDLHVGQDVDKRFNISTQVMLYMAFTGKYMSRK